MRARERECVCVSMYCTTLTGVVIFPRRMELELQLEKCLHPAKRGQVGAADVGCRFPRVVDVAIGVDVIVVRFCCGGRRGCRRGRGRGDGGCPYKSADVIAMGGWFWRWGRGGSGRRGGGGGGRW